MDVIRDDLWFCVDCTLFACNGDLGGCDALRAYQVTNGAEKLGPNVVPNFDAETGEGHEEFSRRRCACCGSGLAGEFHRFAVLG